MSVFFINPFFFEAGADYESIATVTVGSGGASSIEFTSIPGTYQHLQVRLIARTTAVQGNSGDGAYVGLRFNSDSGSNYVQHQLLGNGASASAGAFTSQTQGYLQRIATDNETASIFGGIVADILDYANTSKNTVTRSLGGIDNNGSGRIYLASNLWLNTAAVTAVTLLPEAGNFKQHTTAALYGIKAP